VAIIGAGRLGTALARALRAADVDVIGPLGRGETLPPVDAALLCVPDAEIRGVAAGIGDVRFVGHTSGATQLSALDCAGGAFGIHPLQTFAGGEGPQAFHGIGCAIGGATPSALSLARGLAERAGMKPVEIRDEDRAAYHAAASVASNFVVTLEATAEQIAAGAGLDLDQARALFAPLVRSTVENWIARGPTAALTGPIARGDQATVVRQRRAVAEHAPQALALFDELVTRTRALAGDHGAVAA
jgi:predicted short-subunit dehydrogenase-like oxidoreductase (DUF2520 family)